MTWADSLVGAAAQIRANLRTPMPRTWVERGIGAFGGLADYFEADLRGRRCCGIESPPAPRSAGAA